MSFEARLSQRPLRNQQTCFDRVMNSPNARSLFQYYAEFHQGLLWPCMSVLVGHWFPPTEKSTALAIATTGNQVCQHALVLTVRT